MSILDYVLREKERVNGKKISLCNREKKKIKDWLREREREKDKEREREREKYM